MHGRKQLAEEAIKRLVKVTFQLTAQPATSTVMHDFRVSWRSIYVCKSLKQLVQIRWLDCNSRTPTRSQESHLKLVAAIAISSPHGKMRTGTPLS